MTSRRTGPANSLSPNDAVTGTPASSSFPNLPLPRSASPSSGITHFLSKPSRWFTRSASASKATEPRSSTGSTTTRKHKISRPTDPRPILDGYAAGGSRSVLDLSQHAHHRTPGEGGLPPSMPSSPTVPSSLGDLRHISRKPWSKSADDLGQTSIANIHHNSNTNLVSAFQDKVLQYRTRSGSSASAVTPSPPPSSASMSSSRHPFPTIQTNFPPVPSVPVTPSTPTSATLPTVSISTPISDEQHVKNPSPIGANVHTRSYSFTPKQSSKLANQRFVSPSPKRKGSAASERELDARERERENQNQNQNPSQERVPPSPVTPLKSTLPFGLAGKGGGGGGGGVGSDSGAQTQTIPGAHHRTTTVGSLLAPPTIIEPNDMEDGIDDTSKEVDPKRFSQIVYYSSFINRLADSSSSLSSSSWSHLQHANARVSVNLSSAKSWKPFKMELKGSKLYFYKPPSDRAGAIKELFPTGLVPVSVEEDEEAGSRGGGGGGGESSSVSKNMVMVGEDGEVLRRGGGGRKKRAFWGRRTHPELVLDQGERVEKGSFEALVHEAVFATTFKVEETTMEVVKEEEENEDEDEDEDDDECDDDKNLNEQRHAYGRTQAWRDFASSVILCFPSLVGQAKFESEFLRCCSYLISGANAASPPPSPSLSPLPSLSPNPKPNLDPNPDGDANHNNPELDALKSHVIWLAMEYLRYHGSPVDQAAWEEWREEVVPDLSVPSSSFGRTSMPGMPTSSSMQALYVPPTPMLGSGIGVGVESPRLDMFSPRPEEGARLVSLVEALEGFGVQVRDGGVVATAVVPPASPVMVTPKKPHHRQQQHPHHHHHQQQQQKQKQQQYPPGTVTRVPWSALEKEGLSRDVLFAVDPQIMAQSLTLYHRTVLECAPDNVTAESVFLGSSVEAGDMGESSSVTAAEFDAYHLRPLFGMDEQPHWLTKLLLLQILGNDTSTGQVAAAASVAGANIGAGAGTGVPGAAIPGPAGAGRKSEDNRTHHPASRTTHSRSEVISAWIRIGEMCRQAGDECSWRAILAALCSRPVARLDKVWKRVDLQSLAMIESWIHPNEEGETVDVGEPRSTPWGGDVKARMKDELDRARRGAAEEGNGGGGVFRVDMLERARMLFEGFRTSFLLCPRKTFLVDGEVDGDVMRMVGFWKEMAAEGGGVGGLAAKFQRVEQFMSLSLAAEPRRKGLFEPYYWTRGPSSSSFNIQQHQPLLPLLFPEPLPSLHLLDRTQLVRGRVDSEASDVFNMRASPEHQRSTAAAAVHLQRNRDLLSQQGTVIPVYNGELLLVVQKGAPVDSAPNSRPTSFATTNTNTTNTTSRPPSSIDEAPIMPDKTISRKPSIRVKPSSSQGLERKTSMAKRSSLPSLSQRPNFVITEPSTNPPLRVVVQAGTLTTLVKILVQGLPGVSVSVADDNGEMSLREDISRELVLDRNEFARVWWNVFRSFMTPLAFFEALRKLYITSQPQSSTPSVNDYLHVGNHRGQVLSTLREWLALGGGAQDVLDDAQLYAAIRSFLDSAMDHAVFESEHFADPMVQQAWDGLKQAKGTLGHFFISQTRRPRPTRIPLTHHMRVGARLMHPQGGRERELPLPDVDRVDPGEFVDNLDGMVSAAFSNVTEEDLYVLSDLLEVQMADRTGWFSYREVATVEESVEIQSMYSHLQEVEPSSLIPELGHENLYRLLPPSIRGCIRAYTILRKWLILKLIAPRLGARGRQTRMEFFLQVLEVTRLRNMERPDPSQMAVQPCVRSFVEAVVSSALISVESRIHQRPWQNVAANRGVTCDSLMALLSRPHTDRANVRLDLTVDMGWLIERMLEVIVTPDVIDSTVHEGQVLVNFDKRRQLYNLINSTPSLALARRHVQSDEFNRRGFECLTYVEKEMAHIQFDIRGIKEEAMREALHAATGGNQSAKKIAKPFHKIVAYQMEKNRRDKNLRTRLQKEKLYEQARSDKREDVLNKALKSRKPPPFVQKQHRNKKSMSAFLSFMRPLSSAFGADTFQSPGLKRTASELDFKATGKPAQVLSLMDAHVAQFVNNERSYTFKLDTEDGGHYILQAMSKRELMTWLETISRVAKSATKRRLTYLGNSPKPVLSDHLHMEPINASRDPTAVFGVELDQLLQREAGGPVPPGSVPRVIHECLSEVESRGLSEVGIYRIAGAATEINALKDAFNRGEGPLRPETDIHAVCDVVKSWFRVLPEPVFPPSSYYDIMQKMQLENLEERLAAIRNIVQRLPQANFDLLRRVSEHLDKVTDFEEHNQMTAEALAIVFSPNLMRAPQNDFVMILANMGHTHKLVKALITHYHVIFDETDAEVEAPSEDDYDAPIPEEEEEEEGEEAGDEHRSRTPDDQTNERTITADHDSI